VESEERRGGSSTAARSDAVRMGETLSMLKK